MPVTDDEQTTVQQSFEQPADLTIHKSGPAAADASGQVTYTIVITNNGPATATGADLKDVLPKGMSLADVATTQGLCFPSPSGALCQFGPIPVNEVITVTVVADVDAGVADGTILTNTAQIFANNPDPNPADNSSSAGTTIAANADLQVSKTVSPSPAVPGQQVTYNIVVTNAGPADATGVILTDTLPVELGSVTVTPSQGVCDSTTGVCALGTIPAGGTATVSVVGTISASVTGTFTNSVSVTSPVADPAPANNSADAPTAVAPAADLALSLGSTPTATGGQTATVTVTVQNNGPSRRGGHGDHRHPAA